MLAVAFASAMGCDNYFERKDLEREQKQLLQKKAQLEQAMQDATGGKTFAHQDLFQLGHVHFLDDLIDDGFGRKLVDLLRE